MTFTLLSLEDARARMPKWKRMLRLLYLLLPLSCFHGVADIRYRSIIWIELESTGGPLFNQIGAGMLNLSGIVSTCLLMFEILMLLVAPDSTGDHLPPFCAKTSVFAVDRRCWYELGVSEPFCTQHPPPKRWAPEGADLFSTPDS